MACLRILLEQLPQLKTFQRVSVAVKVLQIEEPIEVNGGKRKQDILVGDSSATTRFTVWEDEIRALKEKQSYQVCGVVVCEYRGTRFLSTSKDNSCIEKIEDIGTVSTDEQLKSPDDHNISHVKNACIVGVMNLDTFNSCIRCNAKVIHNADE